MEVRDEALHGRELVVDASGKGGDGSVLHISQ